MARDPLEYVMRKTVRFTFKTAETILKETIKLGASLTAFALKETAKGIISLTKWGAKKVAEKKLKRERVVEVPMSYFEKKDRELQQEQTLQKEESKQETLEPKEKKRRFVLKKENNLRPKHVVSQKQTPEVEQTIVPEAVVVEAVEPVQKAVVIDEVTPENEAQPSLEEPLVIEVLPMEAGLKGKPISTILNDEPSLEELKNSLKEALRKEIEEEIRVEVLKEMAEEKDKNNEKDAQVQKEAPKKEQEVVKEQEAKKEKEVTKKEPVKEEQKKEKAPKVNPEVAKKKENLERLIKLINQNFKGTSSLEGNLKEEVQIQLMASLDGAMKDLKALNKQIKLEALAQKETEKEAKQETTKEKNAEVKKPKDEKSYEETHSKEKIEEEKAFKLQFESTYEEKKEASPELFESRENRLNELAALKENEKDAAVKALYEKEEALLRDDVSSSAYYATEANVKNEEAKYNFQKGLVEAVNFGDVDTFKKEYHGKFDTVASDIAKYNYLLKEAEKDGNETEQNYWKDRIAGTAKDNIDVLREEILPLKDNENVDAAKYYAYENMIVLDDQKDKHKALGVQEAKEFGDNVVEFAKEYTKAAKKIAAQNSNQKEQHNELG